MQGEKTLGLKIIGLKGAMVVLKVFSIITTIIGIKENKIISMMPHP